LRNWAGNYRYLARTLHRPRTLEQLRDVVSRAPRIRVLGSQHSFNAIADSDELVSLEELPHDIRIGDGTVSCSAAATYTELCAALEREGLALHNLASLPHISVGGSVATATHGSGDRLGNLATAVRSLELVTSDGGTATSSRGTDDFDGVVVGLGCLGAVTRVTLDTQPAYEVSQRVFECLPWPTFDARFDHIFGAGYSVSAFTDWKDVTQIWVKSRDAGPDELFGATPADGDRHPIAGLDPSNCTPQLGAPGRSHERLPHFRTGFTPSSGDELQSEFFVARSDALEAIARVRAHADVIRPFLQISEIRTIAADDLWMSPQYKRDSVGIHFTWTQSPDVSRAITAVEQALAPVEARPHWGKLFSRPARYERARDFKALAERLDPRGAFRNQWSDRYVFN